MGNQAGESLKLNKKISKAEQEAERYLGKIVVLLSEAKEIELAFLAKMLYLKPVKLRYWLVKKRLWNDFISVEKRDGKWWVILEGPKKAWLAAVYEVSEPKPLPVFEGGNELFKRMIEIGKRGNIALFAHELEDGRILLFNFNGKTGKFFACIPLRPSDILVNGEYEYKIYNPEARSLMVKALELFGFRGEIRIEGGKITHFQPAGWIWTFKTIVVIKIGKEVLNRTLKEGVIEVKGVQEG